MDAALRIGSLLELIFFSTKIHLKNQPSTSTPDPTGAPMKYAFLSCLILSSALSTTHMDSW